MHKIERPFTGEVALNRTFPSPKTTFEARHRPDSVVATTHVRADLSQLAVDLSQEVDQLLANVMAHETASATLEIELIELSEALDAAQSGRKPKSRGK